LNFPCGDNSHTTYIVIEATDNAAASIKVDSFYGGKALNIGTVAEAYLYGSLKISGCSTEPSGTSSSFADFPVGSGCTYTATGNVSAPSTMLNGFTVNNFPPGEMVIEATGAIGTGASTGCATVISDGTHTSIDTTYRYSTTSPVGHMKISLPQG